MANTTTVTMTMLGCSRRTPERFRAFREKIEQEHFVSLRLSFRWASRSASSPVSIVVDFLKVEDSTGLVERLILGSVIRLSDFHDLLLKRTFGFRNCLNREVPTERFCLLRS